MAETESLGKYTPKEIDKTWDSFVEKSGMRDIYPDDILAGLRTALEVIHLNKGEELLKEPGPHNLTDRIHIVLAGSVNSIMTRTNRYTRHLNSGEYLGIIDLTFPDDETSITQVITSDNDDGADILVIPSGRYIFVDGEATGIAKHTLEAIRHRVELINSRLNADITDRLETS